MVWEKERGRYREVGNLILNQRSWYDVWTIWSSSKTTSIFDTSHFVSINGTTPNHSEQLRKFWLGHYYAYSVCRLQGNYILVVCIEAIDIIVKTKLYKLKTVKVWEALSLRNLKSLTYFEIWKRIHSMRR